MSSEKTDPKLQTDFPRDENAAVLMLSGRKFFFGCAALAVIILFAGHRTALPASLLAAEVFATILGLFLFGSFQISDSQECSNLRHAADHRCDVLRIEQFGLAYAISARMVGGHGSRRICFRFTDWIGLIHADTMLFILGLTFFVSVIAQTRLLEGLTFYLLHQFRGAVLPTVIAVTAVVAFASGILDGVSMIGLTIRTLVIIMLLAAAPIAEVRYSVMVCTTVTTVCGIWLAYGEPPNLIMKANLYPHIDNAFFLRYCAPAAVACYLVIAWNFRKRLRGEQIELDKMDVIDANAEDVRFLQAMRHGKVATSLELVEDYENELGDKADVVRERLREGESLGIALLHAGVPDALRKKLLGHFVSDELAETLDRHYVLDAAGDHHGALEAERAVDDELAATGRQRQVAQKFGALALVPFIGMLIWHGIDHTVPLFLASFAGFGVALLGIIKLAKMRNLALRDAKHEFAEYYFLFPLFVSITLLTKAGFFDQLQSLVQLGIQTLGYCASRFCQIFGLHLSFGDLGQQRRRRLCLANAAKFGYFNFASIRHGADCGICLGRLLDAYRVGAIGGRFRVYSARYRRPLYAGAVDQGDYAGDPGNDGGDNGHSLY